MKGIMEGTLERLLEEAGNGADELWNSKMAFYWLDAWRGIAGSIPTSPAYRYVKITKEHDTEINAFVSIRYALTGKLYRVFDMKGLKNMYGGRFIEDGKPPDYPFTSVSTNPYSLLKLWLPNLAVLVEMEKADLDGVIRHQGYTTRSTADSRIIDIPQSSDNSCEEEHRVPVKAAKWADIRKKAYIVDRAFEVDFPALKSEFPGLEMAYEDDIEFAAELNSIEDGSVPL